MAVPDDRARKATAPYGAVGERIGRDSLLVAEDIAAQNANLLGIEGMPNPQLIAEKAYIAELLELGILANASCSTILNFYNSRAALADVRKAFSRAITAECRD